MLKKLCTQNENLNLINGNYKLMKDNEQFCAFIIILLIIIGGFCILTIINNNSNKPAEQPPGIFITGQNGGNKNIIIVKDTRRNLQWEAFEYWHSLVIIPGTETPIKTAP